MTRIQPNGTLRIHEDESQYIGNLYQHYHKQGLEAPKLDIQVIRRSKVEFGNSNKIESGVKITTKKNRLKDPWLYDYILDKADVNVHDAADSLDAEGPVPSKKFTKRFEDMKGMGSGRGPLNDTAPRRLIYENQGSQYTETMPMPKQPDGAPLRRELVGQNQVSSQTMREKLNLEWDQKEADHQIAFKKGANLDLILEKLIENSSWQMESGEDGGVNEGSGAGHDEGYDIDPETYASRISELTPGSLVEINSTEISVPFLSVYLKNKTGNYSREAFVLTPQGSIQLKKPDMSRFTLPDFIPPEHIDALLENAKRTGRFDQELVQDITRLVRDFKAKVHLRYPNFSAMVDPAHAQLLREIQINDKGMKVVSTEYVAKLMTGGTDPTKEDKYATHLALLARRDLFSVTEGLHDETVWEIKSVESVERAKRVERLIRESISDENSEGGKMINAFVEKARRVIDFGRQARREGKGVEEMDEELGVEWTDEEMDLLKALEEALEYRRGQSVTLKSLYPHVLGLVDRYDKDRLLDGQRLFDFLGEVGVCSPWEDSVLRDPELGLPGHRAGVETEEDGKLYAAIENEEGSVEKLGLKDVMEGLRHDWGDMPVYTIDDQSTKDIDDGISLESIKDSKDVWLHIHIANPTAFIPLDHWIAKIAAKKVETFYGPARNYSMIPLRISMEKLGLAPNRPAMTFSVRVDSETGDQKETKIRASVVNNVKQVPYSFVNKLVGVKLPKMTVLSNKPIVEKEEDFEPEVDEKDIENLKSFYKLAWQLFQRRVREGCTEVSKQADVDVIVDNGHGNLIHPGLLKKPVLDVYEPTITLKFSEQTRSKDSFTAMGAVREVMTVAGEAAAIWSHKRGMMQLYRQHEFTWQTDTEKEKWLALWSKSKDEYGIVPIDFWKLYFPVGGSKVTPHIARHTALGLDGYVKVTSPLRRFGDFVSHHIIQRQLLLEHEGYKGDKKLLEKPMYTEEEMEEFCVSLRQREQMFRSADKATIRLWGIRLLKQLWEQQDPRLPQEVEVEIISIGKHPSPCSGEIRGLGISGARVYMPSNVIKTLKYGDVVKGKLSPWHWSTDSNNSQILALEYSDFVTTMSEVKKNFFERIGVGARWEQI
ncbi:hypothetical protein TWF730_002148 [Orbilia blumenaviensis]|uniref:RNB domain-containing protein n=1 Tax=Orbilia blumenaviensis TaxID=1796055 RepID=A0AAV9UDQ6_9PEZI